MATRKMASKVAGLVVLTVISYGDVTRPKKRGSCGSKGDQYGWRRVLNKDKRVKTNKNEPKIIIKKKKKKPKKKKKKKKTLKKI